MDTGSDAEGCSEIGLFCSPIVSSAFPFAVVAPAFASLFKCACLLSALLFVDGSVQADRLSSMLGSREIERRLCSR